MDIEHARELLAEERRRIELALGELTESERGESVRGSDESLGDEGADLNERELEGGLADQLADELRALERAEARLAGGTYGLSIESGEPIPDERLEARPLAERTIEEERRFERGG